MTIPAHPDSRHGNPGTGGTDPADTGWSAVGVRIATAALPHFGIAADAPKELLPLSENIALRVSPLGERTVVVRVTRPEARTHTELRSELAWLQALKSDSDVPVTGVRSTPGGEFVIELPDPVTGAPACVAVFEHVNGHEPQEDELMRLMPDLGRVSARLHAHAGTWARPAWFHRGRWDAEAAFGAAPRWGRWTAGVPDAAHRDLLTRMEQTVCRRLERFGQGPERFGLIHADLRTANLLVDGDRFHLIDFDDAGFGWWLYDLATAMTFYENHPQRDELVAAWVNAYREIRPLPAADEAEIPTFLALRRLLTLAFLGNTPDIEVSATMLPGLPEQTCELAEEYLTRFA